MRKTPTITKRETLRSFVIRKALKQIKEADQQAFPGRKPVSVESGMPCPSPSCGDILIWWVHTDGRYEIYCKNCVTLKGNWKKKERK